jgi:hypothetical protein
MPWLIEIFYEKDAEKKLFIYEFSNMDCQAPFSRRWIVAFCLFKYDF